MEAAQEYIVTLGGWYQRTTLHLSELSRFLLRADSDLPLNKDKLSEHQRNLELEEVVRETDYLEYVRFKTRGGIEVRYYEDGLYVLEARGKDILQLQDKLNSYFKEKFEPATKYIFSLGAPTPKILANINTSHPIAVGAITKSPASFEVDEQTFGRVYSKLESPELTVYKTSDYIFVAVTPQEAKLMQDLIEMQVFFREFKDQLAKYLNIHRIIWEDIARIKDRRDIRGRQVEEISSKLDEYQKTVNLITNRINQMSTYIKTRASASKDLGVDKHLSTLFEYKFEVLEDTLKYIIEIWKMTTDYLESAIQKVSEINTRITNSSIGSLRVITTVGVVTSVVGYLSISKYPSISQFGLAYFVALFAITWIVNWLIGFIYRNIRYKINIHDKYSDI